VTDGKDALTFLRHAAPFAHAPCPALIISDLHLPRLDACEFLVEVRRLPAHHATPVVIFSAADKDLEEAHCLQLGASAYVQKPADPYDFFAAIRAMVSTWLPQDRSR
jgi:CheY-like chemotaxis protein